MVRYVMQDVTLIGAGGFGGKRTSEKAKVRIPCLSYKIRHRELYAASYLICFFFLQAPLPPPKRAPDAVVIDFLNIFLIEITSSAQATT